MRAHYIGLTAGGGDCIGCGGCEERCPFGVHVVERMEKADILFQHILKAVQFVPLYQRLYHIYFFPEIRVFARS